MRRDNVRFKAAKLPSAFDGAVREIGGTPFAAVEDRGAPVTRAAEVETLQVRHGNGGHLREALRVDPIAGQIQAPQGRQARRKGERGGAIPLAVDIDQFEGLQLFPERRGESAHALVAQRQQFKPQVLEAL